MTTTTVPAPGTATCRLCGDPLRMAASTALDEWVWVDGAGHQMGVAPEFRHLPGHDPWARMDFLSRALTAAEGYPLSRVSRTRLYRAYELEYTALMIRTGGNGHAKVHHVHWPTAGSVPPYAGPPPAHCCGWPGLLRPSGWSCRQCGATLSPEPVPVP